jgi:hypothetical protein
VRCAGWLFAALQVLAVGFTNSRYFFSQLGDAVFDGLLHADRLSEDVAARVSRDHPR